MAPPCAKGAPPEQAGLRKNRFQKGAKGGAVEAMGVKAGGCAKKVQRLPGGGGAPGGSRPLSPQGARPAGSHHSPPHTPWAARVLGSARHDACHTSPTPHALRAARRARLHGPAPCDDLSPHLLMRGTPPIAARCRSARARARLPGGRTTANVRARKYVFHSMLRWQSTVAGA